MMMTMMIIMPSGLPTLEDIIFQTHHEGRRYGASIDFALHLEMLGPSMPKDKPFTVPLVTANLSNYFKLWCKVGNLNCLIS